MANGDNGRPSTILTTVHGFSSSSTLLIQEYTHNKAIKRSFLFRNKNGFRILVQLKMTKI